MKERVFRHLVHYASFADTLTLSISGIRRSRPLHAVRLGLNRPIGGDGSRYSRLQEGVCAASGNPFQLRYGKFSECRFIPSYRLTLRSEKSALTRCAVDRTVAALFRKSARCQVSLVEVTSDTQMPIRFFRQHSVRKLRKTENGDTFYLGAPASDWQLRLYKKTPTVVRVEFILRRGFLRCKKIEKTQDLVRLRSMNLYASFRLRELRFHIRALCHSLPTPRIISLCRWKCWDADHFLKTCPEELLLRSMLRRFIW